MGKEIRYEKVEADEWALFHRVRVKFDGTWIRCNGSERECFVPWKAIIKGKVPNTGVLAFWIAAVVMGVLKIRCFWIAWTVSFVVCAYLCGIGRTGIEREEEGSAIRLMPVLFIGVLLATSVLNASEAASSLDGTTASGWSAFDQETAPIVDALKGTDARIFSSDDTLMNYFEWEDIKVSYDMRPEIWAKAIAGERTHDDYKRYVDVVLNPAEVAVVSIEMKPHETSSLRIL